MKNRQILRVILVILLLLNIEWYLQTHPRKPDHLFYPRTRVVWTNKKTPTLLQSLLDFVYPERFSHVGSEETSIANHSLLIRSVTLPRKLSPELEAATKAVQLSMFSESSPLALCSTSLASQSELTFGNVMKRAFRIGAAKTDSSELSQTSDTSTDTLLSAWLTSPPDYLWPLRSIWPQNETGIYSAACAPLTLLAVVNRIDFGKISNGQVEGAEIRFDFAAVPLHENDNPFFTAIIEFTLPSMAKSDFHNMALDWLALDSTGPGDLNAVQRLIDKYLSNSSDIHARIRTNLMTTDDDQWRFDQLAFSTTGLVPEPLDRQSKFETTNTNHCVGDSLAADSPIDDALSAYVTRNLDAISRSDFSFPIGTSLAINTAQIASSAHHVLTLGNSLATASTRESTRFLLSLNSCVGCHSNETVSEPAQAAPFDQIVFRGIGNTAYLSGFLAGQPGAEPTQDKWSIQPNLASCQPDLGATSAPQYYYNDLLRRYEYLYTVANVLSDTDDDDVWRANLDDLGLTAYQSH